MARKNEGYEAIARHVFENLPLYMPYAKYAGVFLVGFVSGMLWSQYLAEEEAAAKPAARQTAKKTTAGSTKIAKDESKPAKSTKKKTTAKPVNKLLDAQEVEEPPADTPKSPDATQNDPGPG